MVERPIRNHKVYLDLRQRVSGCRRKQNDCASDVGIQHFGALIVLWIRRVLRIIAILYKQRWVDSYIPALKDMVNGWLVSCYRHMSMRFMVYSSMDAV